MPIVLELEHPTQERLDQIENIQTGLAEKLDVAA
jgi:hypothetical protein